MGSKTKWGLLDYHEPSHLPLRCGIHMQNFKCWIYKMGQYHHPMQVTGELRLLGWEVVPLPRQAPCEHALIARLCELHCASIETKSPCRQVPVNPGVPPSLYSRSILL